jgi:ABC-type transport system substrate-binding protein
VYELVQGMLAQLGFDTTLDVTNYDAFAARVTANTYNTASMNWVALDPDQVMPTMLSCGEVTGAGQFNRTRICDPNLDKMIADAGASADNATRTALYDQIQVDTMKNAWIEPLYDSVNTILTAGSVQGMTFDLEGRPLLYNVSLK